jgi:hypothetical protein
VAIVAGVLLLLAGLGLTAGGIATLALDHNRDEAGYVTSSTVAVTTETAAVTVEGVELHVTEGWASNLPWPDTVRIVVSAPPGTPLFLGIGPEADVDAWLAGTAHDEMTGVYAGEGARYDRAAGAIRPVRSPAGQPFWVVSDTGTGTLTVDWTVTEGRYAAVLTNASGRTEVTADVTVGADLPSLAPVGWGTTGTGLTLVVLGVLLLYVGAAGLGERHTPAGPTGPAPPPTFPVPPTALPRPTPQPEAERNEPRVTPG